MPDPTSFPELGKRLPGGSRGCYRLAQVGGGRRGSVGGKKSCPCPDVALGTFALPQPLSQHPAGGLRFSTAPSAPPSPRLYPPPCLSFPCCGAGAGAGQVISCPLHPGGGMYLGVQQGEQCDAPGLAAGRLGLSQEGSGIRADPARLWTDWGGGAQLGALSMGKVWKWG